MWEKWTLGPGTHVLLWSIGVGTGIHRVHLLWFAIPPCKRETARVKNSCLHEQLGTTRLCRCVWCVWGLPLLGLLYGAASSLLCIRLSPRSLLSLPSSRCLSLSRSRSRSLSHSRSLSRSLSLSRSISRSTFSICFSTLKPSPGSPEDQKR